MTRRPSSGQQCAAVVMVGALLMVALSSGATAAPGASGSGSITIVQDSQPDAAQDFSVNGCEIGAGCVMLAFDDDADPALPSEFHASGLRAGTYTLTQAAVPGWSLSSLVCDTGESVDLSARRVTISLAAGEHTTCTFTNAPAASSGSITFVQDTEPDQSRDFYFTGCRQGAGCATVVLDDDQDATRPRSYTASGLAPGTYSILQAMAWRTAFVWDLEVECNVATSYEADLRRVTFELVAGQDVVCTFVNRLANDDLADAITVSRGEQHIASNVGATTQPGEITTAPGGVDLGGGSVWFRIDVGGSPGDDDYRLSVRLDCEVAPPGSFSIAVYDPDVTFTPVRIWDTTSPCPEIKRFYMGSGTRPVLVAVRTLGGYTGPFTFRWDVRQDVPF